MKQMANEMTAEEAVKQIKENCYFASISEKTKQALDKAMKALEQQPCGDCISREDAIDFIIDNYGVSCGSLTNGIKDHLPPVYPERPKGKWIEVDVRNCHATLKCSVCDRVIEPVFTFGEYSYEDIKRFYPYCHCGAEMSGGGEDEDSD